MTTKGWKALLCVIACISLAGCSGTRRFYKGPQLPAEKVAHLTNDISTTIRLLAINEERFSSRSGFDVELLPGSYRLTLAVQAMEPTRTARSDPVSVDLNVVAGEIYHVVAKLDMVQSDFEIVVVDRTKKNRVLDAGPFSMSVSAVKRYDRGGLTFEQSNEIIQRTLPPLNPPHR